MIMTTIYQTTGKQAEYETFFRKIFHLAYVAQP